GLLRSRIVSSSNGYLNQGEYTLHFGLPPDPDPSHPDVDLSFEAGVDFKGNRDQGTLRVDRHANPVLGAVALATLENREIVVYRGGRVPLDGADFRPAHPTLPLLTTAGGLAFSGHDTPLPDPTASPAPDWFVGIEVSTVGAPATQRVEEVVFDG